MSAIGFLFLATTAEAKPGRADESANPSPSPTAATAPVSQPPRSPIEVKRLPDQEMYREAQGLLVQSGLEERVQAAAMFATLTRSDDRELSEIAKERFDKAIGKIAEQNSARAVEAVITAWRTHGQKGDFDAAIDRVYAQLAEQAKKPMSTTFASNGSVSTGASCGLREQLLTDLVVISSERHVKDLAGWRMSFAEHATTCAPTIESRIKAYEIFVTMNKLPEAAAVATQIGNDFFTRFTSGVETPWKASDFNLAADYWGKAGVTPAQREAELLAVAERAAAALQWEAAAVVYEWLGKKAEARAMRKTLEPANK